jgi:hypothetical protein
MALRPADFRRQLFWAVVTGSLFFGWVGYLVFVVWSLPHGPNGGPVVLSRPQFLISDMNVRAQVDSPEKPVTIIEVVYPAEDNAALQGKQILVTNLKDCHPLPSGNSQDEKSPLDDFRGPGQYILPLRSHSISLLPAVGLMAQPWSALPLLVAQDRLKNLTPGLVLYEVAPTPPSPGYPRTARRTGPPRIYPDIEATRAQLKQIQKSE